MILLVIVHEVLHLRHQVLLISYLVVIQIISLSVLLGSLGLLLGSLLLLLPLILWLGALPWIINKSLRCLLSQVLLGWRHFLVPVRLLACLPVFLLDLCNHPLLCLIIKIRVHDHVNLLVVVAQLTSQNHAVLLLLSVLAQQFARKLLTATSVFRVLVVASSIVTNLVRWVKEDLSLRVYVILIVLWLTVQLTSWISL